MERGPDIRETPAARDQLSQNLIIFSSEAEGDKSNGISDIDSVSDFTDIDTDQDRSSDSESDTKITWDELSREENDGEGGERGHSLPGTHTSN